MSHATASAGAGFRQRFVRRPLPWREATARLRRPIPPATPQEPDSPRRPAVPPPRHIAAPSQRSAHSREQLHRRPRAATAHWPSTDASRLRKSHMLRIANAIGLFATLYAAVLLMRFA